MCYSQYENKKKTLQRQRFCIYCKWNSVQSRSVGAGFSRNEDSLGGSSLFNRGLATLKETLHLSVRWSIGLWVSKDQVKKVCKSVFLPPMLAVHPALFLHELRELPISSRALFILYPQPSYSLIPLLRWLLLQNFYHFSIF